MKSQIMYMELKTCDEGHNDRGTARVGRVTFSKTGSTIYYKGKTFRKGRGGTCGNYYDVDTDDEYWISGCKRNGEDRYPWAKNSPVEIDEDVREEYWTEIRNQPEKMNQSRA